jgi:hypothetical protein
MNALLELHIAPNRLYRINLVRLSSKSNAYLKFATLSAPNSFKSGTEIAQAPQNCISVAKSTASLRKSWCEWRTAIKTPSLHQMSSSQQSTHVTPVKTTIRPWIGTTPNPEHGYTTYRNIKLCVKDHQVYTVKPVPTLFRRRFQVERINQYSRSR